MLHKTRGLVIHTSQYAETSIIAKIYTELFGMQSYIINSIRSRKPKVRNNLFQPLTLVELVVYHKQNSGLQRISEISSRPQFNTLPYHVIKSTVAIFINEVIYRSIREEEANPELFGFLFNAINILDLDSTDCTNFHLLFMLQFSKYLGVFPHGQYDSTHPVFDLQEGRFIASLPNHPFFIQHDASSMLQKLILCSFENHHRLIIPNHIRKELLHSLVTYFQLHHTGGTELKSHHVLEEVFA